MIIELFFVFFFTFAALFILRKVAKHIGLVDTPNLRKQHEGVVPLVGGIAVFSSISYFLFSHPDILPHTGLLLLCLFTLIVVGAIDDKFDISFKYRLVVQVALTCVMMYFTGLELNFIGNILGSGDMNFGWAASVVTIFAVLAAINAFNMVDGIDGLLGGLSMVTFTGMAVLLNLSQQHELAYVCVVVVVAMAPYVMMNMGFLGRERRVFMGDAGSMMIGFLVIWILLTVTQPNATPIMRPVTALWLIALPLMDMAAIMYRRVKRGRSPFYPDRDHLHHIFQRVGLSKLATLFTICSFSATCALVGVLGEYFMVSEVILFLGFVVTFAIYSITLLRNWPKRLAELVDEAMNQSKGEFVPLRPVNKLQKVHGVKVRQERRG